MKKIMIIEIVVLVVLLIVAIWACAGLTGTPRTPEETSTTQADQTTEMTDQTTTVETTEPEPTWLLHDEGRQILAQQYFVYDCQTDTFVTSSASAGERVYPASVTKLFTAYIALQYLQPDTMITAGDELDLVAWGSSVAKLERGDTLSAEQLVEAMLLPSGNDAAYVLATYVGRLLDNAPGESATAAVETFMEEMNSQAAELGMTGTHFVNPDGIHSDNHYMSYADLCLLGELALGNETIMRYASTARETVTLSAGEVEWKNTNKLIHEDSEYYCPYALGLKTGQTPTAGSCLLSAFEKDGKQWIIGVFGCPEEEDRFDDTLQLFNQTIGAD